MPQKHPSIDRLGLRERLAERVFHAPDEQRGKFGLEVELFPFRWEDDNARPRHVRIDSDAEGREGSFELILDFARQHQISLKMPDGEILVTDSIERGLFTFEPGGQVEYSGAPRMSPAAAYHETASLLDALIAGAAARDIQFHALGFNPWHSVEEIGLNTDAARYRTMDAVYQSIGSFGRRMMRQSATVHVNVDLGDAERARRRWQAAQFLAPIAIATFAFSPICEGEPTGYSSFRGRVWTEVDPSRCGFPTAFLADPEGNPIDHYLAFALAARVLMVDHEGEWRGQTSPLPFEVWMSEGKYGTYPDPSDWERHLTTLFPEVRPRGFFELRSADCQGRAFWSVPLTWWTALLCDDAALATVIERLWRGAPELPARFLDGARSGAASARLGDDAVYLYELAADALARLPEGYLSEEMRRAFQVFGQRFTLARRTPADELLERVGRSGLNRATLANLERDWLSAAGVTTMAAGVRCGNSA